LLAFAWCWQAATCINISPFLTTINYAHLHSDTLWIRSREETKLLSALQSRGAFVVTNHGVDRDVMDNAWSDAAAFFDSDAANKNSVPMTRDYLYGFQGMRKEELSRSESDTDEGSDSKPSSLDEKETFQVLIGATNSSRSAHVRWPAQPRTMKESWTAYYRELERLSLGLLQSIASISNASQSFFAEHSDDHVSALRAAHYPSIEGDELEKGAYRCSPHSDWTLLTVLRQDEVGGLEIESATEPERWLSVVTDFYDFVVNAGDLMERWSNGRFKAIRHRVVDVQDSRRITRRRQSMAYFCFPDENVIIAPVRGIGASGGNASEPAVFETVEVGAYLRAKHHSAQSYDD